MFRVEIETDNAVFAGEDLAIEVCLHLKELATKIANMTREDCVVMSNRGTQFAIRDSNGNRIGTARFTDIAEDHSDPVGDDTDAEDET